MAKSYDVIVVGAALNGLAAAVTLAGNAVRRPLDVLVVDAQDPANFATAGFDGRASAVTASACKMFDALGVWAGVAPHAQAMNEIIVTDARPGTSMRPVLLNFGEPEPGGKPSAYMVENRYLYGQLLQCANASPHVTFVTGAPVSEFRFGPGLAHVRLADGAEHRASLVVAADGRNSPARKAAGIAMHGWSYGQTGIVATVQHELPHHGRAEEHFTPSGPFAILPLTGNRSSLVWTEWENDAARILALSDEGFLGELTKRFGNHLGALSLTSGRYGYPLAMFIAEEFVRPRLALIGDAAHVVHPLAGLGLNLGLRDVAALAESIHDAAGLGLDPGGDAILERYSVWRRFDTVLTAAAMDGLNRLFANDNGALRMLRDRGLAAVNRIPQLKAMFASEAAGQFGSLPKLMRGEQV